MNRILKYAAALLMAGSIPAMALAGNPDRAGQAGATQLLVNPWARNSGWGGTNMSMMTGVESMSFNVGGMVYTRGTEFALSRAAWLGGNLGFNINSAGAVVKLGARDSSGFRKNALGVSLTSFSFGDITTTTTANPESAGRYSPQMMNLCLAYSHAFSSNISGGFIVRTISEGVFNAKASGVALDAGIQYRAGRYDRAHFGVALRNVGPAMSMSGDGLSVRATTLGSDYERTVEQRSSSYELPSVLNIAAAYDVITDTGFANKLTLAASFTSNAFSQDQIGIGAQFSFRRYLQLRAGYVYEKGIFSATESVSAFSGPSAGASINIPFGQGRTRVLGVDYSVRAGRPFSATHTFGLRLNI